ncbi:hypothetical protein DM01DRAFT_1074392 [Hesseltinella vesiculosa]|uniref:Uncharacterized protein n=1 Tax=Hesseltinella vesiculosa TaxID=101127 RepID=A0A1X2GVZ5_9FUNG|nr:hypothetical protein DM01DRAFT_1074392 [Hesseltinella vesiculosa]
MLLALSQAVGTFTHHAAAVSSLNLTSSSSEAVTFPPHAKPFVPRSSTICCPSKHPNLILSADKSMPTHDHATAKVHVNCR